jgi:hypothetical protein
MILVALRQCPIWSDYPKVNEYTLMVCQDTSVIYVQDAILCDPQAIECLLKLGVQNIKFEDIPQTLTSQNTYLELSTMAQSVIATSKL